MLRCHRLLHVGRESPDSDVTAMEATIVTWCGCEG